MNPERSNQSPFKETSSLKEGDNFEIRKLVKTAKGREEISLPGGAERDFETDKYLITEYHADSGRTHEEFAKLKSFYEAAQQELGDLLPGSFFVEGESSDGKEGRSFYVVQKFESGEFSRTAKKLDELNQREFSVEFLNQLLAVQEKIYSFLENHSTSEHSQWLDEKILDPKTFKEDILHSPKTGQTKIVNFFRLSPELTKDALGSTSGFEPSEERLKMLKMLGLASLVGKINWAIEKSAAPEWVQGQNVHWALDRAKLERDGKKAMALTFDDGPNEETLQLLDILKRHDVKATFFLVGSLIPGREHIVKRIVDEGHDVGVHEWEHDIPAIENIASRAGLKDYSRRFVGPRRDLGGVKKTAELIEKVTGTRPVLGRVAGVHGTIDSLREFQSQVLSIIHASPYDVVRMAPNPRLIAETLYRRAVDHNGQGRIRLFHIGNITNEGREIARAAIDKSKGEVYPPEQTLRMMDTYLKESRRQGYEFVKVKDYI